MTLPSDTEGSEFVEFEEKPLRIFPVVREALDRIRPHESVNQPDLEAFCRSFRDKGLFYKPILVDGASGTILDGTHRWAGLKEMGATHAPVIKFSYQDNDDIVVGTWYPVSHREISVFVEFMDDREYEYSAVEPCPVASISSDDVWLLGSDQHYQIEAEPVDLFHELESQFDFQYTQSVDQLVNVVEEGSVGFHRPPPDKEDVVDIAQTGESVPPKYTCHRFPFKYPHIMTRLRELVPDE